MKKSSRQAFTESITVQERDCADFVLVPVKFLNALREEIDGMRVQLGLSRRQWEPTESGAGLAEPPQEQP